MPINAKAADKAMNDEAKEAAVQAKVIEKRRALGRGLESLLPGPHQAKTGLAPHSDRIGGGTGVPPQGDKISGGTGVPPHPGKSGGGETSVPIDQRRAFPESASTQTTASPAVPARAAVTPFSPSPFSPTRITAAEPPTGAGGTTIADLRAEEGGSAATPERGPAREGLGASQTPTTAEPAEGQAPVGRWQQGEGSRSGELRAAEFRTPELHTAELPSAEDASASGEGVGPGAEAAMPRQGQFGAATGDEVVRLAVDSIDHNPHQTRRDFAPEVLRELAASIQMQGVLQPIVVRPDGKGGFKLILGERRLRASRLAGIETIPAIVKRVSEQQAAEMTLVENLQRQDLNCVEQADAFLKLSQKFGLTQEEIGQRVGMSREAVANYIRLLTLPESVLSALLGGRLTFSHARALMGLKSPVEIWTLAKRAIEENLKVADLEKLVKGIDLPHLKTQGAPRGARLVDPNVRAAQRSLEEVLGMRVRIQDRQGRGKITIEYGTIDDFERVVGMLRGRN